MILAILRDLSPAGLGWPHSLGGSNRFEKFLEPVFAREARCLPGRRGSAGQLAAGKKEEEHTSPVEYFLMVLFHRRGGGRIGHGVEVLSRCRKRLCGAHRGQSSQPVYIALLNKYYVDEGYDYAFTGRRKWETCALESWDWVRPPWFDSHVIDGTVNAAGWMTRLSGNDFQLVG